MSKLERLLNPQERILWSGRPEKKAFVLPVTAAIPFGLIFLSFAIFWMWGAASAGAPDFFTLFGLPFVLVGFAITIGPLLWQILRYRNTEYMITGKRIKPISTVAAACNPMEFENQSMVRPIRKESKITL